MHAMPDDFSHDVFLGSSSKDKALVRELVAGLKKDGSSEFRHSNLLSALAFLVTNEVPVKLQYADMRRGESMAERGTTINL